MPTATVWEITQYRLRNDDGDELSATWMAANNTPANVPINTPFRVRFEVEQTGPTGYYCSASYEYSLNGGAWTAISLGSTVVCLATSSNSAVRTGGGTTQQLGSGSFVHGSISGYVGGGVSGNVSQGQYTEMEITLKVSSGYTSPGDNLLIRLVSHSGYSSSDCSWDVNAQALNSTNQTFTISGVGATKGVGTVVGAGIYNLLPSVKGTTSVGTPATILNVTVVLTGVVGTKGVGAPLGPTPVSTTITGVQGTKGVGAPTSPLSVVVALMVPTSMASAVGVVGGPVSVAVALTGVKVTGTFTAQQRCFAQVAYTSFWKPTSGSPTVLVTPWSGVTGDSGSGMAMGSGGSAILNCYTTLNTNGGISGATYGISTTPGDWVYNPFYQTPPNSSIEQYRSPVAGNGVILPGFWEISIPALAVTNFGMSYRWVIRLWRSTCSDGWTGPFTSITPSGMDVINAANEILTPIIANQTSTPQVSYVRFAMPQITLTNEYLYWDISIQALGLAAGEPASVNTYYSSSAFFSVPNYPTAATVALTGITKTATAGTVFGPLSVAATLTGVQGTKGVGTPVGFGAMAIPTGQQASATPGAPAVSGTTKYTIAGVAGTKGVGAPVGTGGTTLAVPLPSVTKTATAGTLTAAGTLNAQARPAGIEADTAAGTVNVSLPVSFVLTGAEDTAAAGALTAAGTENAAVALAGVEDAAAAGDATAAGTECVAAAVTGVEDTTAIGTVAADGTVGALVALAGTDGTTAAGTLGVATSLEVTATLGTVLGATAHGTLGVATSGGNSVSATGALVGASTLHGLAWRYRPVTGTTTGTSAARATPDGSRVFAPAWGNSAVRAGAQVSRVARATARSQALVIGLAGHVTVATGQTLHGSSTAHATEGAHLVTGVAVARGTSSVLVAAQVIPAAEADIEGRGDAAADTQVVYSAEGIVLAGDRYDLDGNAQPSTTLAYAGSTCHAAAAAHGGSRAMASAPASVAATGTLTGSSDAFYLEVVTYDAEVLEGICAAQATACVSMNAKALSVNRCYAVATLSYDPVLMAGALLGGSIARGLGTIAWNERPPR